MVANYSIVDVFDAIFDDIDRMWDKQSSSPVYAGSFPPCDVYINEETKDLALEFAVAGIPEDDIDLSIEGDYLFLEVKKNDRNKENYSIMQKGIKSSYVKRKFYIPTIHYQLDKLKIKLADGILSIDIPAKEEMKVKKLKING